MIFIFILSFLQNSLPLLFAALGGLFSERSGIVNIALEGFMLVGAFVGAITALATGSPYLGFLAAGLAGALYATLYASAVLWGRSDQIVAGTAINMLAMGMIPLATKYLFDSTGATPALPLEAKFLYFPLFAVAVVNAFSYLLMRFSVMGQWISFAGESPHTVKAAGLSVQKIRFSAVVVSGALAAWGGASLSLYLASGYSRNMVAGRGFIALAALIFGKWRVAPTVAACLFFGAMESAQTYAQGAGLWPFTVLPNQLMQALPYVLTLLVLAGVVGQARAPRALGTS